MYFMYLNTANIGGIEITKIGISKDPEKRLAPFNCGIGHRAKGGHCPQVTFVRRVTLRAESKDFAKIAEKSYKRRNRDFLLSGFGSEVFSMDVADSYHSLCEVLNGLS